MVPINANIDLLIINQGEVADVRVVDFEQLLYATAAITATATPAVPPAGQILFTATTGATTFQMGAGYSFTALPPVGAGHQFTKYLQPIEGKWITSAAAYRYGAPVLPRWILDPSLETLSTDTNYYMQLTLPMKWVGQLNVVNPIKLFPLGTTPTFPLLMQSFADQLNANPQFAMLATAVVVGNTLRIDGLKADLVLSAGFPQLGPGGQNGFHQGLTTFINTIAGSGPGMGTADYMKNLVRRWKGNGVNTGSQLWEQETERLYELFNATGCYDIYHLIWSNNPNQFLQQMGQYTNRNETYIAIERATGAPTVPNADASIMATKTMLRNYLNEKNGFGLLADVSFDGLAATGIWGS